MAKAILYDATKCVACRGCQVVCKQWNELKAEFTENRGSYENPKDLSPETWIKMEFREIPRNGSVAWLFTRRACMHCTDAGCVTACPTGAVYHHDLGFVAYDKGKCTGCGYCVDFCPFEVPQLDGSRVTGLGRIDKCTFCTTHGLDRIGNGLEPACVKTCPPGALIYGDRGELVAEGNKRVAALGGNATLYGENELDGLHVLYVLTDSPETYGLPKDPKVSAAATAWKDIIQPLGWAAGGLVAGGLLINLIVARARQIRAEEEK